MFEATSVRVQVASVKCRVSEWASVKVLSEWVRCRIFELMKGQSNKKGQKPPKAYSHPIRHHHCAKGLLTKGCCTKGASTEGSFVVLSTITQVSLQLICQVRLAFQNHGHNRQGWGFLWLCKKLHNLGNILALCVVFFHVCFIYLHFLLQSL